MASSNFDDVGKFHAKFGLPYVSNSLYAVPNNTVSLDLLEFRTSFLQEELEEFIQAKDRDDIPEMFDALLDLVWVALGTAHIMNLPWQAGWEEIRRANMSKVRAAPDGSDSKRGSGWDVVKPEGWEGPRHETLLRALGWEPGP